MQRFRIPLFILLFAAVPFVAAAQRTMPSQEEHGRGPGMRMDESLRTLQRNLNLSDSQAARVKELAESRRSRLESIREETRPKFRELMGLLSKPNPDPYAVGQAAIALKQTHEKAMADQAGLEKDFMNILNDTQRQTVDKLRTEAPTVLALHRLGLLPSDRNMEEQASLSGR